MILSVNEQVIHKDCFNKIMKALDSGGSISFVILSGQPRGIGKRFLAKQTALALTKKVNILNLIDEERVSVSRIREMQEWAAVRPFVGLKVLLLCSNSIAEVGYNMLLKTLEEPPEHLRIILVVNDNSVPITIRSRAMFLLVPPLSVEQVEEIFVMKGMLRTRAKVLLILQMAAQLPIPASHVSETQRLFLHLSN